MVDDVPDSEKWRRFRVIEKLQEGIAAEIHQKLLDQTLPVLFEEKKKNRWVGRTENMDLVFVESQDDLTGKIIPVKISWTGPWTLIGTIAG